MEFHLLYQGPLRSEGGSNTEPKGRAQDKHKLRKHFHPQLRELWNLDPALSRQASMSCSRIAKSDGGYMYGIYPKAMVPNPVFKSYLDWIADDHQQCGGRFIPLVSNLGGFACSLDILFLRRDNPGNMIRSGGDIDNRIKVLLDGLRMPENDAELGGIPIDSQAENPFFCLLEDDNLITKLSVTTDRLILPCGDSEAVHDVFLDIHVTILNPGALFVGNRLA